MSNRVDGHCWFAGYIFKALVAGALTYIKLNDQTRPMPIPIPARTELFVRYLAGVAALHLLWEVVQLPLYTLWRGSPLSTIAFAVVHCTLGDVLIAACSLYLAVVACGGSQWPQVRFLRVALLAGVMGLTYTVFSEWNNTAITRTWAYSSLMPTWWGIGLSPLLQWLVIPALAFWRLSKQTAGTRV